MKKEKKGRGKYKEKKEKWKKNRCYYSQCLRMKHLYDSSFYPSAIFPICKKSKQFSNARNLIINTQATKDHENYSPMKNLTTFRTYCSYNINPSLHKEGGRGYNIPHQLACPTCVPSGQTSVETPLQVPGKCCCRDLLNRLPFSHLWKSVRVKYLEWLSNILWSYSNP